ENPRGCVEGRTFAKSSGTHVAGGLSLAYTGQRAFAQPSRVRAREPGLHEQKDCFFGPGWEGRYTPVIAATRRVTGRSYKIGAWSRRRSARRCQQRFAIATVIPAFGSYRVGCRIIAAVIASLRASQ